MKHQIIVAVTLEVDPDRDSRNDPTHEAIEAWLAAAPDVLGTAVIDGYVDADGVPVATA